MKIPFKFTAPPTGWLDKFPDGDYTIGRGADPRGKAVAPKRAKKAAGKRRKPKASPVAAE
jgi:hypothetical protein